MQQKRQFIIILCLLGFVICRAENPYTITFPGAKWASPNIIRVPFSLTGTLITVRARVDTLEGNFFFDTGASGLVLNERHFSGSRRSASEGAGSVTGTVKVKGIKKIDTLQMDNLIIRQVQGDLVDLTHIERSKKLDLVGLLGFAVFKDYEILLDYAASLLVLIRIDNKGIPIEGLPAWEYLPQGGSDINVAGHIGVIKLKFGKKSKWFGIDSGAEQNLLHHLAGKGFLKDNFEIRKRIKLRGASKESLEVLTGVLMNAHIDTFTYKPMATILTNLDEINTAYRTDLDGILGYEFLSQRIISINIRRKRISFYTKGQTP